MSEEKLGFVGKQVKDIYGTFIGKVVGIITEIDGEIETVGVDCGSGGLKQLPYEQLVIQGDYVFFIPKWRLDAQRLLRQKSLTLKRIKALQDIVAENDSMKEDAEVVYVKYEKKLVELEGVEKQVNDTLNSRIGELDAEARNIKAVLFDAKLQFRSNEMKEETYQQIKVQTDELIEQINNEKTEIGNVRTKLAAQTIENISAATAAPAVEAAAADQAAPGEPAAAEAAPAQQQVSATGTEERVATVSADSGEQAPSETSWLNQVITK
jgi:archaellum component FlaC